MRDGDRASGGGRGDVRWRVVAWGGAAFLLAWAQLAVGVVARPGGRVFAVLVVLAIAGAVAIRLRRKRGRA